MSLKYISRKKMQEMRFHVEIEGNTCNEFEFEECRPRLELRFILRWCEEDEGDTRFLRSKYSSSV